MCAVTAGAGPQPVVCLPPHGGPVTVMLPRDVHPGVSSRGSSGDNGVTGRALVQTVWLLQGTMGCTWVGTSSAKTWCCP